TVENLLADYDQWEAAYEKNGGDRNLVLAMGWFKGLSTEHLQARGAVTLNLIDGSVLVEADGLPEDGSWDCWLVENEPGHSIMPEPGDRMIKAGTLSKRGDLATLQARLGGKFFESFQLDFVVITRSGQSPVESRVLLGAPDLYYKLHRSGETGTFGLLRGEQPPHSSSSDTLLSRLSRFLAPRTEAQIGPIPNPKTPLELLITK